MFRALVAGVTVTLLGLVLAWPAPSVYGQQDKQGGVQKKDQGTQGDQGNQGGNPNVQPGKKKVTPADQGKKKPAVPPTEEEDGQNGQQGEQGESQNGQMGEQGETQNGEATEPEPQKKKLPTKKG
jgi:hypothetical protein